MRIKINSASASEIANLYGISKQRAENIIKFRDENGAFNGPEDLAKVPDVSLNLVKTLAPHIDWYPLAPISLVKKRDWSDGIFWILISFASLVCITLIFIVISYSNNRNMLFNPPGSGYKIASVTSGFFSLLFFLIFTLCRAFVSLTNKFDLSLKLAKYGLFALASATCATSIFLVSIVFYYQFVPIFSENPSTSNGSNTNITIISIGLIFLYLLVIPQLIVLWKPKLINSRWLIGFYDAGIGLSGLFLMIGLQLGSGFLPLPVLILIALIGLMVFSIYIISIRRSDSFFRYSIDFINFQNLNSKKKSIEEVRQWLKDYLPNTNHQEEIRDYLNQEYRPSLPQRILQFVVVGVGGWLFITSVDAILQYYVIIWWQDFLSWWQSNFNL